MTIWHSPGKILWISKIICYSWKVTDDKNQFFVQPFKSKRKLIDQQTWLPCNSNKYILGNGKGKWVQYKYMSTLKV